MNLQRTNISQTILTSEIACMCRDVFPSSRCLFLYRDVVAVAKSFSRISAVDPMLRLVSSLGSLRPDDEAGRQVGRFDRFRLLRSSRQRSRARRSLLRSGNLDVSRRASTRVRRPRRALRGPQLNSTENYGRRCLTPLSPHRNYILS